MFRSTSDRAIFSICCARDSLTSVGNATGTFTVWRIMAQRRMVAKPKAIKAELQRRKRHRISEVGA